MTDRNDPEIGYRIADKMGLEIVEPLGLFGADGHVYRLQDGRVLKISFQEAECAVSCVLLELSRQGKLPDFLPEICELALDEEESSSHTKVYVIIREDIADFTPPCNPNTWRNIMDAFKPIWSYRQHAMKAFIYKWTAEDPAIGSALTDIYNVANTLLEKHDVMVHDLKDNNIGVLANGKITIRDMGQCAPPEWSLDVVQASDFPVVSSPLARMM